ncbi:Protein F57C2.5 [Aphelenchoides avenae]|nr:Protein F57C2.5 [Aphelenchus avenae]
MSLGSFLSGLLLPLSIAFLGVALLLQRGDYQPQKFTLPPPPKLEGSLKLNVIKEPQYILKGNIRSPESIYVDGNTLYTGLGDGRIVKIVDGVIKKSLRHSKHNKECDGIKDERTYCGRPLGIRKLRDELFVVTDSALGVYTVDFAKGTTEMILPSYTVIDGRPAKFIDDFDFLDNDTLIVSDASTRFGFNSAKKALFEHAGDGRVLQVKLSTGKATTLIDGLNFPNGVQMHSDRQSVLITETVGARVIRYYFAGPKKGKHENFAENLPGHPDNIRASSHGTYYVAIAIPRHPDHPSIYDRTQNAPWVRKIVGELYEYEFFRNIFSLQLVQRWLEPNEYSLFVELNAKGEIVSSYHDPKGEYIRDISQVSDDGDTYLYLATYNLDRIVRIKKH